jgi:hypothetical protein
VVSIRPTNNLAAGQHLPAWNSLPSRTCKSCREAVDLLSQVVTNCLVSSITLVGIYIVIVSESYVTPIQVSEVVGKTHLDGFKTKPRSAKSCNDLEYEDVARSRVGWAPI